jgi:maltooligosyltrehalose trehalohydrolase
MRHTDNLFGPLLRTNDRIIFQLWAPSVPAVELLIEGHSPTRMEKSSDGFFRVETVASPGDRYKFRTNGVAFPDPASRQQDNDGNGWSIVGLPHPPPTSVDPIRPWHETVICEVHVGTATPTGTFSALRDRLEHFRDAGYTCLEVMPVNETPGGRNWGYDGTLIFAPDASLGTPDELRDLVDRAHELDLGVILDVVYNHFGEEQNYLQSYAPEWFDPSIETPWGPGIDFDQETVRKFYYENAVMWLSEYGFDGLRFDAIHEIKSASRDRFLGELAQACRIARPKARLIIENVENAARWLERDAHNTPMTFTAQWNDDMHHVLAFLVTREGRKTGYDDPKKDPIADLEKALANGFVHDREEGPESDGRTRGGPASRLPPDCFITYVENHDQIGNRSDGKRLSERIAPEQVDFLHFVKFIAPQVPLCFMGDEANLTSGFPFFVDLPPEAGDMADQRRYREMREMFSEEIEDGTLPHPNDPQTFATAKLAWDDFSQEGHVAALRRFRELARIRRDMVWPLAATPCIDTRTARRGTALIVNWVFEAGTLTLALNASAGAIDIPCVIQSAPVSTGIYSQQGENLHLGAWSAVAWKR